MIGALAVACFVKVYGTVFLGTPRTRASAYAHESPLSMRLPMAVLAACCAFIGLLPVLLTPILDHAITGWRLDLDSVPLSLRAIAPLEAVSVMSISLVALIAALTMGLVFRNRVLRQVGTWDCGYAHPTSRIQYTASSFAQMIVAMFNWVLHPRVHRPHIKGLFPVPAKMHSHVDDLVLDRILVPAGLAVAQWCGWFHRFQQGMTQQYVLYILITVILMLSTLIPFNEYIIRLFAR
jgi:hydrogenase-4 component B